MHKRNGSNCLLPSSHNTLFQNLTRRVCLVCAAVIVTVGTIGRFRIFPISVTVGAVHLAVSFVELQTGHRVIEVLLVPSGMTTNALVIQPCNLFSGRMTGATIEFLVESIERPTGFRVREGRFFDGTMTFAAVVGLVTIAANGMDFHL